MAFPSFRGLGDTCTPSQFHERQTMHDPLCRLSDPACAEGEPGHVLMDNAANGLIALQDPFCGLCMGPCTCRSLRLARLQGPIGAKHAAICWCAECVAGDPEKREAIREELVRERARIADAIHGLPHDDCSDDDGCREWGNMDRVLAGETYTIERGKAVFPS